MKWLAEAYTFIKSSSPSWVFFMFFKFYKFYQIVQSVSFKLRPYQFPFVVISLYFYKVTSIKILTWNDYSLDLNAQLFSQ